MSANSNSIFRTKSIEDLLAGASGDRALKKVLGPVELVFLGIGAVIGTGIFVLPGVAAANYAGPALILSFIVSGLTCVFASLCYAELASMIPIAGSAYTFGYVGLGEIWGWIIGWDLALEYMIGLSTVAVGWSGYLVTLLGSFGIHFPAAICNPFGQNGGIINLPAVLIVFVMMLLLIRGITESVKLNNFLVILKLGVIILFIILAVGHIKPANWNPFFPYGVGGVFKGAAVIFFAYVGFDAVSCAAEECKNPQRDLPIGLVGSLIVCTVLYILVAATLTGVLPYLVYKTTAAPVAYALLQVGITWGSALVSVGAVCGLTSALLVTMYGCTRILFALSRDGLLPQVFSTVHPKYRTPVNSTILVAIISMCFSGVLPVMRLAEMANMGTLIAFIIVSASAIVLRKRRPDIERPFRCPAVPIIPSIAMMFCFYLIWELPHFTKVVFAIWIAIGIVIYFAYSKSHSVMEKSQKLGM